MSTAAQLPAETPQTVSTQRNGTRAFLLACLLGCIVAAVSLPIGTLPALGFLLDVWNGVYRTARNAAESNRTETVSIPGLASEVRIYRDERNVPHIFASNDLDAVAALGYLTAQERLFQIDFQSRVASGRLAEVFGKDRIKTDKFLRRTGMLFGAERTWDSIQQHSPEMKSVLEAFTRGANAHISLLSPRDYPFEFRLLGFAPEAWSPLKTILVNQLMAFDLTFQPQLDDVVMEEMRIKFGDSAFAELYPNHLAMNAPQSPEPRGIIHKPSQQSTSFNTNSQQTGAVEKHTIAALLEARQDVGMLFGEPDEGKGSNNWVLSGTKTRSGKPILAGDPHLSLSLPAIWYEVHIATPTMNVYGVTIPGAPTVIIGFNDFVAWSPTNTGADVLDFYSVRFADASQRQYEFKGTWLGTEERIMPLAIKGQATEYDTVRFTRWGPILTVDNISLSARWTAHESSSVLQALWGFNHAHSVEECTRAHQYWDTPAQNIVFADVAGNIAIRSAGYFPIRRRGHGRGIHNGASEEGEWIGRVPFDSVPGSINPHQGWLHSANQEPTPHDYPYYLNYDWGDLWRGRRITEYLSAAPALDAPTLERFQTDVKVMQWEFLKDSLAALQSRLHVSGAKKQALDTLLAWNGYADTANRAALLFYTFLRCLRREVWDEMLVPSQENPAQMELRGNPKDPMMFYLLKYVPSSRWLDNAATPERETAPDVLVRAMAAALDTLLVQYGDNPEHWAWGRHHGLLIRHLIRAEVLRPLWRGIYPFIGFQATVVPAGSLRTTHSASWRMVVDFADGKPRARVVFPGGPSGNPFSRYYDAQIPTWLSGKLYPANKPSSEKDCQQSAMRLSLVAR